MYVRFKIVSTFEKDIFEKLSGHFLILYVHFYSYVNVISYKYKYSRN